MTLLLIKSLFIPKNSFVDTNINSINNFITYFKTVQQKFTKIIIKIVGWIGPIDDSERERLTKYIDNEKDILIKTNSNIVINIEIWESNFGKCYVFQNIKSLYHPFNELDYIIYTDHDISPIDDILTDRFLIESTMITEKYGNREIAMISFCQEPDSRHNDTIFSNKIEFNGRSYFYHMDNIRIATGCFITVPKIFNLLCSIIVSKHTKYENIPHEGIYGDEDMVIGEILNQQNYFHVVSSLRVNHPYFTDDEYTQWKKTQAMTIGLVKILS